MSSVGPLAVNASLYQRMAYDNLKDLTSITLVAHVPNMLGGKSAHRAGADFPGIRGRIRASTSMPPPAARRTSSANT